MRINVNVSELRSLIQDVRRTGKQYVEVTRSDSFEEDGETYPAELSLCTYDPDECIEFDPIQSPSNAAELSAAMDEAIHMSSNLL